MHLSNITRPKLVVALEPDAHFPLSEESQLQRAGGVGGDEDGVWGKAFVDALTAKQKAIRYLRLALERVDAVGSDVLLAAVLFFINFELIHVGKSVWKTHLNGAIKLMTPRGVGEATAGAPSSVLRDCVVTDCLM
jgi:hypothetical protein